MDQVITVYLKLYSAVDRERTHSPGEINDTSNSFMYITHCEDLWQPLCVYDHINKTSFKKPTRYLLDSYQAAIGTGTEKQMIL